MIFMKKALMGLLGWFSRINRVSHVHEETTYAFLIKPSALSQTGIRLPTCMVAMIDNVTERETERTWYLGIRNEI